jgi:hypothetical protein
MIDLRALYVQKRKQTRIKAKSGFAPDGDCKPPKPDRKIIAASDVYFEGAQKLGIEFEDPLSTTNTTAETECLPKHMNNGTCLDQKIVVNLRSFLISRKGVIPKVDSPTDIVQSAIKETGCDAESCMLSQREVVEHLSNEMGGTEAHNEIKKTAKKLKPKGPKDNFSWLNNSDIDDTLRNWADEYTDFYPYCFCMMDFERPLDPSWPKGSLASIKIADLIEGRAAIEGQSPRPFRRMACVLNTDTSTGRGKHWVCLFMNCQPDAQWTIEYFNSSGNPPTKEINAWVAKVLPEFNAMDMKYGPKLGTKFIFYNVQHQRSRTECGMYSLFYIRARLNGIPIEAFNTKRVADEHMKDFRSHIFSKEDLETTIQKIKTNWGFFKC